MWAHIRFSMGILWVRGVQKRYTVDTQYLYVPGSKWLVYKLVFTYFKMRYTGVKSPTDPNH